MALSGFTNDSWVLSNATGRRGTPTWTQLSPSGTLPPARQSDTATYDANNNRLTIAGGSDVNGNLLGDAWVLTNANGRGGTPSWTQLASGSIDFPEARDLHTAVYNPGTNSMTIFGGQIESSTDITTNDVWVLNDANGL